MERTAGTATITRFDDNKVSGDAGATGIRVSGSVTFDGTPGGAFQAVSGGTTSIGASGNGVGGSGMVLTNVSGDLSFTDLDIFASSGTGLSASSSADFNAGSGTGLRVLVNNGVGTLDATGGGA